MTVAPGTLRMSCVPPFPAESSPRMDDCAPFLKSLDAKEKKRKTKKRREKERDGGDTTQDGTPEKFVHVLAGGQPQQSVPRGALVVEILK